MAETLVLAELSIDSSGVVSGVAVAGGALDSLGKKTQDNSRKAQEAGNNVDLLTKRMFNLRTAAIALVGSFSLAGAVLTFKNLLIDIIKADAGFKEFAASAQGLGTALGGIARQATGVGEGLGFLTQKMDALQGVARAVEESGAAEVGQGIIGKILFGTPGVGPILRGLEAVNALFDKLTEKMAKAIEEERKLFDPKRVDEWEAAVKKALAELPGPGGTGIGTLSPGNVFRVIDGIPQIVQMAERLPDVFNDMLDPLREAAELTDHVTAGWKDAEIAVEDTTAEVAAADKVFAQASQSAELAASVIMAFGQALTQGIIEGGLTFKKLLADVLMSLVPVLLGLAAFYFLMQDYAKATYAFAAAVAAALAAKALSGGTGRGYGPASTAAAAGGGTTTNLSVTFAGPTFGFNEMAFARYVNDLQRRAAGSNG